MSTKLDKVLSENLLCRKIVKEISLFEVTQRQRLFIIYLLALELENVELMRSIVELVHDSGQDDIFVTQLGDDDGKINSEG